MEDKSREKVKKLISNLGSLKLTVAGFTILIILVVWGTLYEVENGIFAAQERFFKAWFIMVGGFLPIPAVKTVLSLLTLNLIAAFLRKRALSIKNAGIFILHFGVLLLIIGSAITSTFVKESALSLEENQSATESYNFSQWNLSIILRSHKNDKHSHKYRIKNLKVGQTIEILPSPLSLNIRKVFTNCAAMLDPSDSSNVIALKELKPSKDDRNIPGIAFQLKNKKNQVNNEREEYLYAGLQQFPAVYVYEGDTVILSLEPERMVLPLRITLLKFNVEYYPNSKKAKSYQSRIRALGKNIDREVLIEMNRPFRYGQFTFYQMSYSESHGNYASTFAVVKNPFRYMPYISSLIIAFGIFLHFIVKMIYALPKDKKNKG
ncbi:MAG: cytochrome c biogenesis protein ResB [Chitinispirillaceae bacterium]|nr:cytochrome c biogenesis protein ResB [Chitinispirillaceae bacterium]